MMFRTSPPLVFYAHFFDDGPELLDLALQDRVLLRRRGTDRLGADLAQALRRLGMLNCRQGLLLQPGDHLARRLRRREEAVPAFGFENRETLLAHRGDVRQVGRTAASIRPQRLDIAGIDTA